MDKKTQERWIFLMQVEDWARATIFQGNRLLIASERVAMADNQISKALADEVRWEEEFFLTAFHKVIIYIKELRNNYSEFDKILKKIESVISIEDVLDVRNIRTHDKEYIKGDGTRRNKLEYEFVTNTGIKCKCDAISTIVFSGNPLMGGRANTEVIVDLFNEIYPQIQMSSDKYIQEIIEIGRQEEMKKQG